MRGGSHRSGAVDFRMDPSRSGRVDISLVALGIGVVSRARAAAPPSAPSTPMLGNENDPRNEEYKALFTEFMRLRRTTGEPSRTWTPSTSSRRCARSARS